MGQSQTDTLPALRTKVARAARWGDEAAVRAARAELVTARVRVELDAAAEASVRLSVEQSELVHAAVSRLTAHDEVETEDR